MSEVMADNFEENNANPDNDIAINDMEFSGTHQKNDDLAAASAANNAELVKTN